MFNQQPLTLFNCPSQYMKIFENVILRETTNNLDKPTNTKLSLMSSILTPHRRAPPNSADMNVSKGMGRKKGGRVLLLRWKPNPPHELSQYRPILPTSQTQHHVTVACIMQTVGWRNASYHRVILANSLQPFSGMFLPPLDGCQLFTEENSLVRCLVGRLLLPRTRAMASVNFRSSWERESERRRRGYESSGSSRIC